MASSPDATSDLLEFFKEDAEVSPDYTLQILYQSKPGISRRKVKVEKRWYREKEIGRGTFGIVWLEVDQKEGGASTQRAVKEVSKGLMRNLKIDYKRELLALSRLSKYPREFVDFYGWYENHDNVFLSMEYFQYGDLDQYIATGFSEREAKSITAQLLEGLALMHANHFTHRDLKPQNIFVYATSPQWWVKIGDFGITKRVAGEQTGLYTQTGTPLYRAPEVSGFVDEDEDVYTNAVDVWSLGCVTYQLLAQRVPFANGSAIMRFCSGRISFPEDTLHEKMISEPGISFLQQLLVPESSKRVTVQAALQDPWLESSTESPSPSMADFDALELAQTLVAPHVESRDVNTDPKGDLDKPDSTLHDALQASSRDLESLRLQHNKLSAGMEEIVQYEIESALAQQKLELEASHQQQLKLEVLHQQQLRAARFEEILDYKDIDYFDARFQELCQYSQQWVLRFSKFSDNRPCRLLSEIHDEKIRDRFDNAILDGSDVETFLADRISRRDVFMSVITTMIWEFVFTRYLFGLDRESREKLKSWEEQLAESGPVRIVNHWRAVTLTLLAKRPACVEQSSVDSEKIVNEMFTTLTTLLPPPQNLENLLLTGLGNLTKRAISLSTQMRTQAEDYIMLPPLQPEYDTNGDLARKVYFNASLMNERSGGPLQNEELEQRKAVVRMVLFPLVVRKEGDDDVVVLPAQVLVEPMRNPLAFEDTPVDESNDESSDDESSDDESSDDKSSDDKSSDDESGDDQSRHSPLRSASQNFDILVEEGGNRR